MLYNLVILLEKLKENYERMVMQECFKSVLLNSSIHLLSKLLGALSSRIRLLRKDLGTIHIRD